MVGLKFAISNFPIQSVVPAIVRIFALPAANNIFAFLADIRFLLTAANVDVTSFTPVETVVTILTQCFCAYATHLELLVAFVLHAIPTVTPITM